MTLPHSEVVDTNCVVAGKPWVLTEGENTWVLESEARNKWDCFICMVKQADLSILMNHLLFFFLKNHFFNPKKKKPISSICTPHLVPQQQWILQRKETTAQLQTAQRSQSLHKKISFLQSSMVASLAMFPAARLEKLPGMGIVVHTVWRAKVRWLSS